MPNMVWSNGEYYPFVLHNQPPSTNGSAPRTDGLAHQKRVKEDKLFSQNRKPFHLGSLIWVSDKAENAS